MTSGMTPGSITIPAAGAAGAVVRPAPGWRRARPEASCLNLLAAVRTIPPCALAQGNQIATAHPAIRVRPEQVDLAPPAGITR